MNTQPSHTKPNQTNDWQQRLTIAAPLADNPGRDANGNNSDGSGQHSPCGWLQVNKWY